jgi:hypothetical protein
LLPRSGKGPGTAELFVITAKRPNSRKLIENKLAGVKVSKSGENLPFIFSVL